MLSIFSFTFLLDMASINKNNTWPPSNAGNGKILIKPTLTDKNAKINIT